MQKKKKKNEHNHNFIKNIKLRKIKIILIF